MAQDSRRVRRARRIKRERSQLRQAIGVQQQQLQTVVKLLMEAQAEVRALKPTPSYTIKTLPDDPLFDDVDGNVLPPPGPITEEMNRDCCIDDSPAS